MKFPSPLIRGTLVSRYKRFMADVRLDDGRVVTAACPNTGSMLGLTAPGNVVWLSDSKSETRKYPLTWELVELPEHGLTGINTAHPNRVVEEAVNAGRIAALAGYAPARREVKYGTNSRIDLLLEGDGKAPCYVEVKNVHLLRRPGFAEFPDCVTERGAKHLDELAKVAQRGGRAVMVYLIQNASPRRFALAGDFDPHYVTRYRAARNAGVEAIALACAMSVTGIDAAETIPIEEPH